MESIWLEYAWALLILIGLEGLLSADNALVLAVIAKHFPEKRESGGEGKSGDLGGRRILKKKKKSKQRNDVRLM